MGMAKKLRRKNMDYTKYDFAAIVGAEVSVLLKSKVEYGGTLKLISNKAIFLLMNDNPLALEGRWFAIEDIVPGSLSAKIKVEDMSVNQLKRFIKPRRCCSEAMLIAEDGVHHSLLDSYGEIKYDYDEFDKSFADYVDCTDWGWEK